MKSFSVRMADFEAKQFFVIQEIVTLHRRAVNEFSTSLPVKVEELGDFVEGLLFQLPRLTIREMMQYAGNVSYQAMRHCLLKLESDAIVRRLPKIQFSGKGNCPSILWELSS